MTDTVPTRIVLTETKEVPKAAPPGADAETASALKGYSHPGSFIRFPDGQVLHIQFNANPNNLRNGLLMTEVLEGLIDNLSTYRNGVPIPEDHLTQRQRIDAGATGTPAVYPCTMNSPETDEAVRHLNEALLWLHKRSIDRERRGVRYEDKA